MTVIAWDGKTLAADKQCTSVGHPYIVTKIFRVPGGLVGFVGSGSHAAALLAWFRAGADHARWPKAVSNSADALFIADGGEIRSYSGEDGPTYFVYEGRFAAMGAGRDYALAAMHLGRNARAAVEVACALDTSCGNGVDTLKL